MTKPTVTRRTRPDPPISRRRRHDRALLGEPVDRPAVQRLVQPRVGARVEPVIQLQLEVELVREAAT
jgi:hypothetical protein